MIDFKNLRALIPSHVCDQILEVVDKYKINTPLRLSHFVAQCYHESQGFHVTQENLNYSLDGLLRVFKKYFPVDIAADYVRKPEKIANRVYANRNGNGPESSGDGWLYRGRGYIQLTGKENYAAFDKVVPENILVNPDVVSSKYPMLSAGWFWDQRQLNALADLGADQQVVSDITKKINGGYNGLEDRLKLFDRFYGVFK